MFAIFSPDGYIQVRSIAETKKLSRESIGKWSDKSWDDYAKAGYVESRVLVDIKILD